MIYPLKLDQKLLNSIHHGGCLQFFQQIPTRSIDLIFTSPPYEDARTYGIDYDITNIEYVEWCLLRYEECYRACKGLTAWVIEGRTRKFRYSGTPILLAAKLISDGINLRKPPIYHRVGIPGSGGTDWLRNDYEFIICATHGKLPWSDNVAMGKPPKYAPGGAMSHRTKTGFRAKKPGSYKPPAKANPGNVIHGPVGGGLIGDKLAHENEAPFPEWLAEFFIRSFCPPGGIVLDPFCGSGTTCAVAKKFGRQFIGIDIRESQVSLSRKRVAKVRTVC